MVIPPPRVAGDAPCWPVSRGGSKQTEPENERGADPRRSRSGTTRRSPARRASASLRRRPCRAMPQRRADGAPAAPLRLNRRDAKDRHPALREPPSERLLIHPWISGQPRPPLPQSDHLAGVSCRSEYRERATRWSRERLMIEASESITCGRAASMGRLHQGG